MSTRKQGWGVRDVQGGRAPGARGRHGGIGAALAALFALLSGCSAPAPPPSPEATRGELEQAAQRAERSASPRDLDAQLDLSSIEYRLARRALDDGDSQAYATHLARAEQAALQAARIDPSAPQPHTQLGIISAYQGNLEASAASFRNALALARQLPRFRPGGVFYSNLAHIYVYQGKLSQARRYLERAIRLRAPEDEISRISVLAAWKADDMVEARDLFREAALLSPAFAGSWDQVSLAEPMREFSDFARVCCGNPTCGPHMKDACGREEQRVQERELDREALVREMELERERRITLREIYEKRRDLSITVEDDEPEASPSPDE